MQYALSLLEQEQRKLERQVKNSPRLQQDIKQARVYLQDINDLKKAIKLLKLKNRP